MLIIALIAVILILRTSLGRRLLWFPFALAAHALPLFAGLAAGYWANRHGLGIWGAGLCALVAAAATLALGQFAFATLRAPLARIAVTTLFAAPAAAAGFYTGLGLAHSFGASPFWRDVMGMIGALIAGGAAFARIASVPVATPSVPPAPHHPVAAA